MPSFLVQCRIGIRSLGTGFGYILGHQLRYYNWHHLRIAILDSPQKPIRSFSPNIRIPRKSGRRNSGNPDTWGDLTIIGFCGWCHSQLNLRIRFTRPLYDTNSHFFELRNGVLVFSAYPENPDRPSGFSGYSGSPGDLRRRASSYPSPATKTRLRLFMPFGYGIRGTGSIIFNSTGGFRANQSRKSQTIFSSKIRHKAHTLGISALPDPLTDGQNPLLR